jgi:biopolymer transport protein ExbD
VARQNLGSKLAELKKTLNEEKMELMIQADQEMRYADLDPLIKAGSEAGVEKLKFAVIPTK